jgi:hypothetical protein
MILLRDILIQLASGEFSNIALTRDRDGAIDEKEYERVISHLNLGVVELHKRFSLLNKEITLHADPNVKDYYLHDARVTPLVSITTTDYLEEPDDWTGSLDVIEIKDVYDSDGLRVIMNNRIYSPCVMQMAPDRLKITNLDAATTFNVFYQAHPADIVFNDNLDVDTEIIYLPKTCLEALLNYIAMRVYKPTGSNDSTANSDKSASYQQQYELSCQKIDVLGLDIEEEEITERFEEEGWA